MGITISGDTGRIKWLQRAGRIQVIQGEPVRQQLLGGDDFGSREAA